MNILHVIWSLEFGGIERLVLDLCRVQRSRSHDARVLTGCSEGRLSNEFGVHGIPVISVSLRDGFDLSRSKIRAAADAMTATDVVHFHFFSPLFALAARRASTPVVYTEHGNFGLGRQRSWRDRCKLLWQRKFIRETVAFMTFNSSYTFEVSKRYYAVSAQHAVIPNGINLDRPSHSTGQLCDEIPLDLASAFVVGTTSRFAGFKRVDRLIRSFAQISQVAACYLLLVGDGPLRSDYERLACDLGIRDRTIFTGFQPNVVDYQSLMDVCVFPSEGEPFGLVAVETLAIGKPTIVLNDGGGLTEIVGSFSTTDVVDGEEGLTRRIEEYIRDKNNAGNEFCESRISARIAHTRQYDVKRMTTDFECVYEKVTEKYQLIR